MEIRIHVIEMKIKYFESFDMHLGLFFGIEKNIHFKIQPDVKCTQSKIQYRFQTN